MTLINNKKITHYCVLGLGITGISCLEFLSKKENVKITAADSKETLELQLLAKKFPQVEFFLGELKIPNNVDFLLLSPGINKSLPIISKACSNGARLTSDINLFLEQINILRGSHPIQVVGVTGTNGKTTVVNILAQMAMKSGVNYALCGNVGNPVLNTLSYKDICIYIIELSSFQLELIKDYGCDIACVLNITPDHLDRYVDFNEYCAAKMKIYQNAKKIIYFREDPNILANLPNQLPPSCQVSFGINHDEEHQSFSTNKDRSWLMKDGKNFLPTNQISLLGEHNLLNVLACFAIGELLGFTYENMSYVVKNFTGLQHRCEVVNKFDDGVLWINDSKGTNVGATIAALKNAAKYNNNSKIIIILGGVSKKADLSLLKPFVLDYCKVAILMGECKRELLVLLEGSIDCYLAENLPVAVRMAKKIATREDLVLFSPACASFDMFKDYQDRGNSFKKSVLELYSTYAYSK